MAKNKGINNITMTKILKYDIYEMIKCSFGVCLSRVYQEYVKEAENGSSTDSIMNFIVSTL